MQPSFCARQAQEPPTHTHTHIIIRIPFSPHRCLPSTLTHVLFFASHVPMNQAAEPGDQPVYFGGASSAPVVALHLGPSRT